MNERHNDHHQGKLTESQHCYAVELRKAAARWPKRSLSAEQMREQVRRNHQAVINRQNQGRKEEE